MEKSKKALSDFIKACTWSGSSWLFTLCAMLIIVGGTYVLLHIYSDRGREYVQLDKTQLKIIKRFLDADDHKSNKGDTSDPFQKQKSEQKKPEDKQTKTNKTMPGGSKDSANNEVSKDTTGKNLATAPLVTKEAKTTPNTDSLRIIRNSLILQYLEDEYNDKLVERFKTENDSLHESNLGSLLMKMNNQDVYDYLTDKKLLIESAFWLTGSDIYIEAFLWSLLGVLVSLIFYVSTANANTIKSDSNDIAGAFQPSEIPNQVAKIFYAPAVTIVIVLGYHFFTDKSNNMVDISVNKGLIVFSFIAGFYSGRLMKFLDKLKDLLLPFDGKDSSSNTSSDIKKDVTVKLKLADSMNGDPAAAGIKTVFNSAKVSITREGSTDPKPLEQSKDQQGNIQFISKQLAPGKYTLKATLNSNGVNLKGEESIEVTSSKTDFELALDKTA